MRIVRKHPILRRSAVCALGLALALGASAPVSAKVVVAPWSGNIAFVSSKSKAGSVEDLQTRSASGPDVWAESPLSSADNDTINAHAFAMMTLATSFKDSIFAVSSSGFGSADGPLATNSGGALVYVQFVVERTQSYIAYPVFAAGNFGSRRMVAFVLNMASPDLSFIPLLPDQQTSSGRLAPGVYAYYYQTSYRDEAGSGSPDGASSQVAFWDVTDPLIDQHPQSQTVPAGSSASFSVGASGLAASSASSPLALTYQWRYRLQNLANGGRISGATTPQLHIANVAVSDTGAYDCVVTQGTLQEPSSLARLTVTGVAAAPEGPPIAGLALSPPAPNPSGSRTLVRFTLPGASEVTLDVLDVTGRCVRSLVRGERRTAGSYAVEWDGRSDGGAPTPAGMYFVRLRADPGQRVQRVARLAP